MRKTFFIIILLVLTVFSASSSAKFKAEAEAAVTGTLNIPTADYLNNVGGTRAGLSVLTDVDAGIKINNLSVTAGISVFLNSRTQAYHNLCLKGFIAYGPNLKLLYSFPSSRFTASLKARMLFCSYFNSQDEFLAFTAETAVGYRLGNLDKDYLSLIFPINMTYRKDILGLSFGVGLSVHGGGR